MIKANDLRIGNWIYLLDEYLQINIDNFQMVADGFGEYNGIPLTPEILEKAGFVNEGKDYVLKWRPWRSQEFKWKSDKIGKYCLVWQPEIHPDLNQLSNDYIVFGSCKHLHQLQNLYYALTGEELEINL